MHTFSVLIIERERERERKERRKERKTRKKERKKALGSQAPLQVYWT
jgi:hypothetical protein